MSCFQYFVFLFAESHLVFGHTEDTNRTRSPQAQTTMPSLSSLRFTLGPNNNESNSAVRIAVMGVARVGKSSLIHQFLYGEVPRQYSATVEELHRQDYGSASRGRHRLTLELLDTSGTFEFPAMLNLAMATAHAFILVFAIDDLESFEQVRRLRNDILDARAARKKSAPPIVIVGNKADLAHRRVIGYEVAETVATIDWEHGYVECSALEGVNVVEVFEEVFAQSKVPEVLCPSSRRRQSCPAQVHTTGKRFLQSGLTKRHSCIIS